MTDWGSRLLSVSYFAGWPNHMWNKDDVSIVRRAADAERSKLLIIMCHQCEKWFPSYSAFILLVAALANNDGDRLTCTCPRLWHSLTDSLQCILFTANGWKPEFWEVCRKWQKTVVKTSAQYVWHRTTDVHVHVNSCEEVWHNPLNIPTYQYELWINRPLISDYFRTHAERRGASMLTRWWEKCTEPLLKLAIDKFSLSTCKY